MSEQQPVIQRYLDDGELTASAWRSALRDGWLLGQHCRECGYVTGAPKAACARCGHRQLDVEVLPSDGEVYSQTTIAVAPDGFEGPYRVGLVALGGTRVLGRLPASAEIGDAVTLAGVIDTGERVAPRFESAD